MDQDTQQLDDNNPKSEVSPDVAPEAASDTGQGTPPDTVTQGGTARAQSASSEPVSSMNADERKAALEAIIYAADEPATIEQLAKALSEPKAEVQAALDELVASYASDTRGIEIRGVAGGYKMYTKPQHHDLVRRFIKSLRPPLRLTMPALETLAVISYKQPVTAPEIQEIRGVNTSGVIKTLLDKKLITTAGRKEVIGRPILYRTSKEFLMRFGLSDLGELPSLKEFEALAREALGSDEGVAESDAGDESVLNSMEPTEAEAAAELEAEAAADSNEASPGDTAKPMAEAAAAGADESSAPKQYEQSISPDVVEAIASHLVAAAPVAASAALEPSASTDAVSEQSEPAVETNNPSKSVEPAEPGPVNAVTATQPEPEAADPELISRPIVDANTEMPVMQDSRESEQEQVNESSEASGSSFAESEPVQATRISGASPASPESSFEHEGSYETEQEISDEILAQLTQGIEIEVSADSLAALSSTSIPAEESPNQFYSSDAEPERDLLTTAHPSDAGEHSSEHPASEGDSPNEREKSRGAAAGE